MSENMSSITLQLDKTSTSHWIIGPANDITGFIASALGGYATIFLFKVGIPINTLHALQYQRLLWYHNRNHYANTAVKGTRRFRSLINSSSVVFYLAAGSVTNFASMRSPALVWDCRAFG